jgi:hypothetical protein
MCQLRWCCSIARERGIAAYRAWVPLERIRPVSIPQEKWEETFAWPANNEPPYPPLAQRILRWVISYVTVGLVAGNLEAICRDWIRRVSDGWSDLCARPGSARIPAALIGNPSLPSGTSDIRMLRDIHSACRESARDCALCSTG